MPPEHSGTKLQTCKHCSEWIQPNRAGPQYQDQVLTAFWALWQLYSSRILRIYSSSTNWTLRCLISDYGKWLFILKPLRWIEKLTANLRLHQCSRWNFNFVLPCSRIYLHPDSKMMHFNLVEMRSEMKTQIWKFLRIPDSFIHLQAFLEVYP